MSDGTQAGRPPAERGCGLSAPDDPDGPGPVYATCTVAPWTFLEPDLALTLTSAEGGWPGGGDVVDGFQALCRLDRLREGLSMTRQEYLDLAEILVVNHLLDARWALGDPPEKKGDAGVQPDAVVQ